MSSHIALSGAIGRLLGLVGSDELHKEWERVQATGTHHDFVMFHSRLNSLWAKQREKIYTKNRESERKDKRK